MATKLFLHTSVLLHESVAALNIKKNGIYVDATFGRGGHSRFILSQLGENGRLYGIDRDPHAIEVALGINDPRFEIISGPFSLLEKYITDRELCGKIDGVLMDLGVSSPQLDDAQRGFSFMRDGPLDMRMDPTHGISAAQWIAQAREDELYFVLKNYGEERFARRVARAMVARNRQKPMTTTHEFAEVVAAAIPVREKHKHPATRAFQAIRIQINDELTELQQALAGAVNVLAPLGRLSVMSFHSLEDRIVKRFMRENSQGPKLPTGLPLTEVQRAAMGEPCLKTLGKIMPNEVETSNNIRARSVVLRVAEKKHK